MQPEFLRPEALLHDIPCVLPTERASHPGDERYSAKPSSADTGPPYNPTQMIYCVIPRELADELYDKMVEYYKDNPNVEVIVDRREGPDRRAGKPADEFQEKRLIRDRRRRRPGSFPDTDPPPEAG